MWPGNMTSLTQFGSNDSTLWLVCWCRMTKTYVAFAFGFNDTRFYSDKALADCLFPQVSSCSVKMILPLCISSLFSAHEYMGNSNVLGVRIKPGAAECTVIRCGLMPPLTSQPPPDPVMSSLGSSDCLGRNYNHHSRCYGYWPPE